MFELASPWLFLLLPLPWLVQRIVPPADSQDSMALKIPFFAHAQVLSTQHGYKNQSFKRHKYLVYLAWLLLVIAAAGPQWLGAPVELPQTGRNIMLALDLSGSMQIPDMTLNGRRTSRLNIVKTVARKFIQQRSGDRIGLILFGTKAYLQTPLTFDRKTVLAMLDDASVGLAGPQTAIGDAIGLAIKRLQKVPQSSRVLILLTDGANNAGVLGPIQAAKIAAADHIKIYTIGIGANRLVIPGLFGTQVVNPSSDLDETALRQIATLTGGMFFRATNSEDLKNVYANINKLEPISSNKSMFRPITPYYYYPLALVLLIGFYLALRRINFFKFVLNVSSEQNS